MGLVTIAFLTIGLGALMLLLGRYSNSSRISGFSLPLILVGVALLLGREVLDSPLALGIIGAVMLVWLLRRK